MTQLNSFIPIYEPALVGNERRYVLDCIDSNWISSKGKYVRIFEEEFSKKFKHVHAVTVSNGTVALHLALLALGIGPGDEVIVPSLTYIATVNAISYVGATVVFADIDSKTWNINLNCVESVRSPRTKAVIAVHLYGSACDCFALRTYCDNFNLKLIEDCAEAIGTKIGETFVGNFGHISTFSFFGNKTITCGEGGMVVSDSIKVIERIRYLKNQAVSSSQVYWHDEIGYNYRMTNICAAIGLAQLENIDMFLAKKVALAMNYIELLSDLPLEFQHSIPGSTHSYWMFCILALNTLQRNQIANSLTTKNIEYRPLFYPVHTMPPHLSSHCIPVAEDLSSRGLNLPSFPYLSLEKQQYICSAIKAAY